MAGDIHVAASTRWTSAARTSSEIRSTRAFCAAGKYRSTYIFPIALPIADCVAASARSAREGCGPAPAAARSASACSANARGSTSAKSWMAWKRR